MRMDNWTWRVKALTSLYQGQVGQVHRRPVSITAVFVLKQGLDFQGSLSISISVADSLTININLAWANKLDESYKKVNDAAVHPGIGTSARQIALAISVTLSSIPGAANSALEQKESPEVDETQSSRLA